MNAFRCFPVGYKTNVGYYLRYPHRISSIKLKKDGSVVETEVFEDGSPIIDPLLRADWTDTAEMLKNGVNIAPIVSYTQASLEERMSLLSSTLDSIRYDMDSVKSSIVTSEPISEPTPEPTSEPIS